MRPYALIVCLLLTTQLVKGQYYIRGELKDEQGNGVQGAKITLSSRGSYPYYTGSSGTFGIPSSLKVDTLTFSLDGFDSLISPVNTTDYVHFTLKPAKKRSSYTSLRLTSLTKNLSPESAVLSDLNSGETYSSTIENQFVDASKFPETGFSIHVDRASYSNIRRFIRQKERPPIDAVRIEEMLNYFNLKKKSLQEQKSTFTFSTNIISCPWNRLNKLLFINLHARKLDLEKTPPANLVFLIDISGSMDQPNRLPLLKNAFKLLIENLRPIDTASIVTYGNEVSVLLQPTSGNKKQKMIEAIEGLRPSGATPGASAIRTAYTLAKNIYIPNGNNRVILATDGDFNVGQASEADLEELITQQSKTGIYLTCLGVGMGNYKDSKLEILAKKGHGNFAYLDNETEAEKVLVEEFAQTLYTVASDVYITANFNADAVKAYRLIGFDNNKSALADSIELLGGEVGSGQSLMAAFEIILNPSAPTAGSFPVASFELSYRIPGNSDTLKEKYQTIYNLNEADNQDSCLRFAASVVLFGSMLKQSKFTKNVPWDQLTELATSSANPNDLLQKEFVDLVGKAKKLYPSVKKKKE
jgi:Ca-activated chloride channel family protein